MKVRSSSAASGSVSPARSRVKTGSRVPSSSQVLIAINAWNRLCITTQVEPGQYQPGLREAA
jgi:hypothetical protein